MSNLNVGDLVRFKSGSPEMTILNMTRNQTNNPVDEDDDTFSCLCGWFDHHGHYHHENFHEQFLFRST